MTVTKDTPLTQFPGVGAARAEKLARLGLERAEDLLFRFPRDYEDRRGLSTIRQAPLGIRVCISAMVAETPRLSRIRKGLELVQLKAVDHTGTLYITFFNQGYVRRALEPGVEYIFFGAVEEQGRRRSMVNPVFERADRPSATGRIMPIYHLTAGISNHLLTSLTERAMPCAELLPETLPDAICRHYRLPDLKSALNNIHFPRDEAALEQARRRLVFEELFYLSVGLSLLKDRRGDETGFFVPARPRSDFLALLPFLPTGAQSRVMDEIAADLSSGQPMNRLVQGDVGSGKTAVAAFAAWMVAKGGYQTALMAPTEVLAEQHYRALAGMLSPAGIRVGLLTGSMPAGEKRSVRSALSSGELDLVIGTHALISADVLFARLGLIIADEQHRFGVAQRAALAAKGASGAAPHVLVMSATPIPRTLALIIYGDLDISVIDQLPPGRTPVETYIVREDKRERMYRFVRRQVEQGRQVYLICPAVEDNPDGALTGGGSSASDLKAVTSYAARLQKDVFPDLKLGILHGKLRPQEKENVMAAFAGGKIQVLVATTVVEVGVDVPNASLIIIENADRFGLSQLHQLRGRVGRGKHQSYCVLVTSTRNPDTMQRLRVLSSTTDGFKIAEEDLKLRGPGDFFGSRQHGLPQLKIANLAGETRLLAQAQQAARQLLEQDPELNAPENRQVLAQVRKLFSDTPDIFN